MAEQTMTIFGAGLAGALMAVLLARRGHRVDLYERRADPRVGAPERGRSINLALSTRGIEALRRAGLAEEVLATAIPMRGRMIHPPAADPALTLIPYSRDPSHCINSVSRAGLIVTLLAAAERMPGVRVHFGQRCEGMDFETGRAEVLDVSTGARRYIETRTVIGADGAFSGVRGSMLKRDRFEYSQTYLEHGYKELTIPAAEPEASSKSPQPRRHGDLVDRSRFRMEPNALHIWPRGTYMMIALPNQDGSFTCTLFWPFEGPNSFAELRTSGDVMRFFGGQFPDSLPLIPDLAEAFLRNPASSLVTVRCRPWHVGGRAVLVGDAAHAVVPFYGQGMNCSFEDCVVLEECIEASRGDLAGAYEEYGRRRKANTDALADLAIENFVEMRDRVNDPAFIFRRRVEHALEAIFPEYRSLYEMVTFSRMPYAEARERTRRSEEAVARLGLGAEPMKSLGERIIAIGDRVGSEEGEVLRREARAALEAEVGAERAARFAVDLRG
jgi:kynurenine 3-monooxygenase